MLKESTCPSNLLTINILSQSNQNSKWNCKCVDSDNMYKVITVNPTMDIRELFKNLVEVLEWKAVSENQ